MGRTCGEPDEIELTRHGGEIERLTTRTCTELNRLLKIDRPCSCWSGKISSFVWPVRNAVRGCAVTKATYWPHWVVEVLS